MSTHVLLHPRCINDPQTDIDENGESQSARFSFEVFRFRGHKNLTTSSFYLHCQTRLCDPATCNSLKPVSAIYLLLVQVSDDYFNRFYSLLLRQGERLWAGLGILKIPYINASMKMKMKTNCQ